MLLLKVKGKKYLRNQYYFCVLYIVGDILCMQSVVTEDPPIFPFPFNGLSESTKHRVALVTHPHHAVKFYPRVIRHTFVLFFPNFSFF